MQIETHGQQIDVTPALRDYVETRFERLARHFEHPCQIRVQLGLDKPEHKAEAISRIISDTVNDGKIKLDDPENRSRRYAKYIPFWG